MVTLRWRGHVDTLVCFAVIQWVFLTFLSQITELWHVQCCNCAFTYWAPPTICLLLFSFYPSFLLCLSFSAGSVDVREKGKPHACSARWCLLRYPPFSHTHTHTLILPCKTMTEAVLCVTFALRCLLFFVLLLFITSSSHTHGLSLAFVPDQQIIGSLMMAADSPPHWQKVFKGRPAPAVLSAWCAAKAIHFTDRLQGKKWYDPRGHWRLL